MKARDVVPGWPRPRSVTGGCIHVADDERVPLFLVNPPAGWSIGECMRKAWDIGSEIGYRIRQQRMTDEYRRRRWREVADADGRRF